MSSGHLTTTSPARRRDQATAAVKALIALLGPPARGDLRAITAASVAVVERYPDDIIARLADPLCGIALECRYGFPTIADLTAWLEKQTRPDEFERRRQDREAAWSPAMLPPPKLASGERVPREYLLKHYGENFGIGWVKSPKAANPRSIYRSTPLNERGVQFWKEAQLYIDRLPPGDKQHLPVIKPGSAGWDDWVAYFDAIGYIPSLVVALMENRIDKPRGFTVPAAHPGDFDLTYHS